MVYDTQVAMSREELEKGTAVLGKGSFNNTDPLK